MGVNEELNHGRCTIVYSPVQIHPHLEEAEGHSYNWHLSLGKSREALCPLVRPNQYYESKTHLTNFEIFHSPC